MYGLYDLRSVDAPYNPLKNSFYRSVVLAPEKMKFVEGYIVVTGWLIDWLVN